jgi:hypothetical protein
MNSEHFESELWKTIGAINPPKIENKEFNNVFNRMWPSHASDRHKNVKVSIINDDEILFLENDEIILSIILKHGVFFIKKADDGFMRVVGKSVDLIDAFYLVRFKLSERKLLSEVAPEHKWRHIDPESDEWKMFIPPKYKKWLGDRGKFSWDRDTDWGDGGKATIQLCSRNPCKLLYSIYPSNSGGETSFYTLYHEDRSDGNINSINKTLEEAALSVAVHAEKFHKRGTK